MYMEQQIGSDGWFLCISDFSGHVYGTTIGSDGAEKLWLRMIMFMDKLYIFFYLCYLVSWRFFAIKTVGNLFRRCHQAGRRELPSGNDSCRPTVRKCHFFCTCRLNWTCSVVHVFTQPAACCTDVANNHLPSLPKHQQDKHRKLNTEQRPAQKRGENHVCRLASYFLSRCFCSISGFSGHCFWP